MREKLTVVSIGPGSPDLLTLQSADLLRARSARLFLRTGRHPVAGWLAEQSLPFSTFDDLYDGAGDFDAAYGAMVSRLLEAAKEGPVLYAVPDPLTDVSVRLLLARREEKNASEITVLPGIGTSGAFLPALLPLGATGDLRILPATALLAADFDPAQSLLITEVDSPLLAGDLKIRLSAFLPDEAELWLLRAGDGVLPQARRITLTELDRLKAYDHLTAVFLAGASFLNRSRFSVNDLVHIMDRLRARDGCPWDRVQTHESLKPYLIEEAWEVIQAIDEQDPDHLADELGDVLLQIVFHAAIARDRGDFSLEDVATHICGKMIHRHPHVFGDQSFSTPEAVSDQWEKIKRAETGSRTAADSMNEVPAALPSLKYAAKILRKTDQVPGWPRDPEKIAREMLQLSGRLLSSREGDETPALNERETGVLLFLACQLCRLTGTDAELLLRKTADRFKRCFKAMENAVTAEGKTLEALTIEELCVYWNQTGFSPACD